MFKLSSLIISLILLVGCQIPFQSQSSQENLTKDTTAKPEKQIEEKTTPQKEEKPFELKVTKNPNDLPLDTKIENGKENCQLHYDKTKAGICIITQEDTAQGTTTFYVKNETPGFMTTTIEVQTINMTSDTDLPYTATINPEVITKAFTLKKSKSSGNYTYSFYILPGLKDAKHNNEYVYTLPYKIGTWHIIGQAYNSVITHYGPAAYSVDFTMSEEENIEILATREGVVSQVIDGSNEGCPNPECAEQGNFITIQHDDGTAAWYYHNKYKSAKVKVGDKVKAGQAIALAGCTGFCADPHLHFSVMHPFSGKEYETIPTIFKTNYNETGKLVEEKLYPAVGDKPLKDATLAYPETSLARLPHRMEAVIAKIDDKKEAAKAFLKYMQENVTALNQQWKDLTNAAIAGDRDAQKELEVIMNECAYCMDISKDPYMAKIFDPDKGYVSNDPLMEPEDKKPGFPQESDDARILYWQIFSY